MSLEPRSDIKTADEYKQEISSGGYKASHKLEFGFVKSEDTYDKDLNNYNFARIEEYLAPLFIQKGDGEGGTQIAITIKQQLLNLIYPIGSIYTSIKNVSPATFLGGTWQSLDGYILRAATSGVDDSKYTKDGGNATITLTKEQLPTHNHTIPSHSHTVDSNTRSFLTMKEGRRSSTTGEHSGSGSSWSYFWSDSLDNLLFKGATDAVNLTTNNTGSNNSIDIMPPYKNVYMWVRTA